MMNIYATDDSLLLSVPVTEECEKVESLMQSDHIHLSWRSITGDTLPAGAYVLDASGEKYRLLDPYKPTRVDTAEYKYEPDFQSEVMSWQKVPFFMYTIVEDEITDRETDWTLTADASTFIGRIVLAVNTETGAELTGATDMTGVKTLSFQSQDIFSALNAIANAYETEWWVDKENGVIHLSKASRENESIATLVVGVNVSEPSVTDNSEPYYNRFYAFGSTRNITQGYTGANVNNIANKRLTLDPAQYPGGYYEPDGPQPQVFSKILVFDDIYPAATGLVVYGILSRNVFIYSDGQKVQIGTDGNGDPIYDQYTEYYVRLGYKDGSTYTPLVFNNWNYTDDPEVEHGDEGMLIPGLAVSLNFLSGALMGRDFELKYFETETTVGGSDGEALTIPAGYFRINYTEEGTYRIPASTGLVPAEDDSVVLYNVRMPDEYFADAYDRLEAAMMAEIDAKYSTDLNQYSVKSYPTVFYASNPNLKIGTRVNFTNGSDTLITRVTALTTKVDYPIQQTIVIGNGLAKGTLQTLTEEISDIYIRLNNYINDGASILRIAYDKFLRKDTDDVARGKLTFMGGFDSFGAIEGAQGLKEWNEGNDAHLQVDYLTVLKKAIFNELEIRKLSAAGGNIILSPSASKLFDAIPIYDENITDPVTGQHPITGWKCHILADDGTMATQNNWVVGDQAKCQTFNVQQRNNAGTVANRYYWRVVTEVGDVTYDGNGEVAEQAYIVLSNVQPYYDTGGAGGTDAPAAGDTVVQEGFNFLHWTVAQGEAEADYPHDRSNVILLESSGDGTPKISAYKNIDDFSIAAADLVFSQSPNSVIFNSANFTWQTPSGDSLPQIMDRGEWSASATYNKYDRVSHNGDLYVLQVDGPISGAASEPGVETSGYWLQQTSASAHYAYLSNYADNITVDADGNVIGGLWTEDENENRQYRISAAVYAKRGDASLEYDYSATGRAAAGKYKVSVIGDDCTVSTTNGTIFVTAVAHVKDGVAGSGSGDDDWEDEDYILMRGLQVFRALITIDFEGKEYQTIEMPVQVHHTEESYIGADLTNPMAQVAWNPKTQSFVGFPVTGQMRLWQGSNAEQTALSLTSQSYSDPSELFSVTFASPVDGTYSISPASGSTDSIPDGEYVLSLTGTCKVAGVSYERTQEVRIVKSTAEVVYSLMPSATVIYQTFTGGTSTLNPATFTVDVMATDANGTDALTAAAVSAIGLSVTVNGTAYTAGSTITPSSSVDVYNIILSLDGAQLDVDTIPVLLQGSDGEDGTDVEFAYCRQTGTPTKPATGCPKITSSGYTISGCTWYDHPRGITASNPTEWVSMRKSINDANGHASFANSVWTTPTKWSQWGDKGNDGDGVEYIFARTVNENTAPSNPLASWDYDSPDSSYGWYDDPQGVTASLTAEWVSQRKSVDGVYKNQSWSTPSLWSKYANKGSQGDGVEYIYARTADTSTTPSTSPSASWAYGSPDNTTGWYAVPQGVNTTYKAEWVCQRTSVNGEYAGQSWNGPTLWCNLSEDGDPVPGANAIEAFADPGSLVLKMTINEEGEPQFIDPTTAGQEEPATFVDAIIKIRDGATVMTGGINIISRTPQGCGFGSSPSHPANGVRVRTVDVTSASIYNPLTEDSVSAPVPVTAAYVDVVAQYNGVNYNVRIPVNCEYSSSLSQLTTTSNNIGAFVYDIANGEDGHGRATGINITAGTIAAIADNFILYGSDGETPAVYWDTTAGNYIFNGTIYADAGHFGPLAIATYPWGESYIATPVFVDEGGYSYRTTLAGTEFNISATFGSNTERVTIAPFGDPDRVDTNGVIDIHARAANYPAIYVSQGKIFANGDITSASNITATGAVSAVGAISAGGDILAGGFVQGRMAVNLIDTSVAYTMPTSYFNSFVRVRVTNNPNITVPNGTQNGQWLILVIGGACTLKIKFHSNASYTSTTIPSSTFTRLFFVWYDGEWHQISRE